MKKTLVIAGGIVFAVILFGLLTGRSQLDIPSSASDLKLIDKSGWQSRKFVLRFDDSPESCRAFAVSLMKDHMGQDIEIAEEAFTKFPVSWRGFPEWFDIDRAVKNGTLITGNDWIYAVVDKDRGRLYYYYSH